MQAMAMQQQQQPQMSMQAYPGHMPEQHMHAAVAQRSNSDSQKMQPAQLQSVYETNPYNLMQEKLEPQIGGSQNATQASAPVQPNPYYAVSDQPEDVS